MQIKEYLEKYQPVVYRIIGNAIKDDKLSHAYLISGAVGMPIKEIAEYIAKSILCPNHDPFACDNCLTCARVDEHTYGDLIIVDGSESKIKKGDVEKVMTTFDKTALEKNGVMIYILHLVETMTTVAVNSLLKFLEEPGKNVYAILTTENESKILPTIISRTQVLRLKEIERQTVIEDSIANGVAQDDAELLSGLYFDPNTINTISTDENYLKIKDLVLAQIDALLTSKEDAIFTCESIVINEIKTYPQAKLYLDLLIIFFQDMLNLTSKGDIYLKSYATILEDLSKKIKYVDKALLTLMNSVGQLSLNLNIGLLFDHIIYEITKEE